MTASKHTAMLPDGRAFVSSFARGLKVIESFGPDNRSMTVAEVAERTGVDRAVARRLLLTLVHLGFVHVHERRFELTTHVLRLAYSFLSSAGLGARRAIFWMDVMRFPKCVPTRANMEGLAVAKRGKGPSLRSVNCLAIPGSVCS